MNHGLNLRIRRVIHLLMIDSHQMLVFIFITFEDLNNINNFIFRIFNPIVLQSRYIIILSLVSKVLYF